MMEFEKFIPSYFNKIKKLKSYITTSKSDAGFTLLEVMMAVFVVTVGIIGIFTVIQNLSIQSSYSSNRLIAIYLAQEGMEIIRNVRDTNWLEQQSNPENPWEEGLTGCSVGCEVDYLCTTVEDPSITNPNGHLCLALYSGSLLKIDVNGFYNYSSGTDTKFKRKITITEESTDNLKVEVLVNWQERGKNYEFKIMEKLYKWH